MANTYDVGSIVGDISIDTKDLVKSFASIDRALSSLDSSFANMGKAILASMSGATRGVQTSFDSVNKIIHRGSLQMTIDIGSAANQITASLGTINKNVLKNTREIGDGFSSLNSSLSRHIMAINSTLNTSLTSFRAYSKNATKAFRDLSAGIANNTTQVTGSVNALNSALNANIGRGFNNLSQQMAMQTQILSNTFRNLGITMQNTMTNVGTSIHTNTTNTNQWSGAVTGMFAPLNSIFGMFSKISFQIFIIRQGLQQAAGLFAPFIESGLKLSEKIEVIRLGYAGLLASTALENGGEIPFNRALELSDKLLKQLQLEAVRTALSFEELADAVQTVLAPGIQQGWSLDQIVKLTSTATLAVKSMGLAKGQVIQEVRALVSGKDIRPATDTLARNLGYTTAIIKKLKEEGKLYDDIINRLKGFEIASEDFANTWRGITEGISDGIAMIQKEALTDLFDSMKSGLITIRDMFYEIKTMEVALDDGSIQKVADVKFNPAMLDFFKQIYKALGDTVKIFLEWGKILSPLLPVLQLLWTALKLVIEGFTTITRIITPMLGLWNEIWLAVFGAVNALDTFMFASEGVVDAIKSIIAVLLALKIVFLIFSPITLAITAVTVAVLALLLAIRELKNPTTEFGNYFKTQLEIWKSSALEFWEILKGIGNTMRFNTEGAAQNYIKAREYGSKSTELSKQVGKFPSVGKAISDVFNNLFPKAVEKVKVPEKEEGDLTSKFPEGAKEEKENREAVKELKRQFKLIESQVKQGQQVIKNGIASLESRYAEYGISIYDFYNNKLRLEKQSIDMEISGLERKMDLATEVTEKERLAEQIETARLKKTELDITAQKKLYEEYQKFHQILKDINKEFANVSGNTLEQSKLELLDKYGANYIKIVNELVMAEQELEKVAKGTTESKKWENLIQKSREAMVQLEKVVKIKQAEALIDAQALKVKQVDYELTSRIKNMELDVSNVKMASWKVEEKAHSLRQKANEQYLNEYGKLIAYYEIESRNTTYSITKQIELKQKADETRLALKGILEDMNPIEKAARKTFQTGLADALDAILWKTKSAGEAFRDLGKSLLQTLSKMAFESISASITESLFGGLFGKKIKSETQIDLKVDEFKSIVNVELANAFNKFETGVVNLDFILSEKLIPALNQIGDKTLSGLGNKGLGSSLSGEKGIESASGEGKGGGFSYKSSYADLFNTTTLETTNNMHLLGTSFNNLLPTLKMLTKSQQDVTLKNEETSGMAIPNLLTSLAMVSGNEGLMKFATGLQLVMQVMQMFSGGSGGGKSGGITGIFGSLLGMFTGGVKKASGGYIQGAGTETSDSIPASLSNGEFVIRAAMVRKYGAGFFNGLNTGRLPNHKFAEGGLVGQEKQNNATSLPESNTVSATSAPTVIINANFQSIDPQGGMQLFKDQMPYIKSEMLNAIRTESSMRGAIKAVR